ncbi:hypothetical protein BD779DRAFT_1627971 [Infundibulicybe gibba]|nr:hypothetical protein BD779DRAFT_1627971 [Infundibulicybe gibba]
MSLVWLITGTSTGLGRELTLAALARGDKVIATSRARSLSKLAELKSAGADVLELDVTDSLENLHKIAKEGVEIHGRVDVVVNNAGYLAVGALEESTPQETLDQFNTNVFGALNVSRAFLPYMRKEKKGTVAFLGSIGGWSDVPNAGLYCATKSAIRSITETLHAEISSLGLRAICLELGHFRTGFLAAGHRAPYVPRIEDYYPMSEKADQSRQAYSGNQPGSPGKGVKAIIDVLHGTGVAQGKPFPVVLQLGSDCFKVVTVSCENTLDNLQQWKEVTLGTDI